MAMAWYSIIGLILLIIISTIFISILLKKFYYRYDNKLLDVFLYFNQLTYESKKYNRSDNYDPRYYDYMESTLQNLGITYDILPVHQTPDIMGTLSITSDVIGKIYEYDNKRTYFHRKLKPLYREIINIKKDINHMMLNDKCSIIMDKENIISEYMSNFEPKSFTVQRKLQK